MFICMYVSLAEYAGKTGKDTGNLRKLLKQGRLEGFKIGNQWVVDSDMPCPADGRIRSGGFRFWRKSPALCRIPGMQNAMHELIEDSKAVLGEKLMTVILYGSYSRNEQTEESDVDIALILSSQADSGEIGSLLESVSRTELSLGKVISVVDIEFSRYNEYRTVLPFYRNIDKEGIILWKRERRKSLPSA